LNNILRVGIIGATGMVGQQFVRLLENHPWFKITLLAASSRSAGKEYHIAVSNKWKLSSSIPEYVKNFVVVDANEIAIIKNSCDFVFCAVDLSKEETIKLENSYAEAGLPVFSNNSAQRFAIDVPMIIPEVNSDHLELLRHQQKTRGYDKGFVVVKPNCSLQSYVPVLHAVKEFKPQKVFVTTFQAISGAGKLLEEATELYDNCIPLPGEESKSELEPKKILGTYLDGRIQDSEIAISAHCQRVATSDGHLAALSIKFSEKVSEELIIKALQVYEPVPQSLKLPHAPIPCITVFTEPERPQVKLDRMVGNGMGLAVGRIRTCPLFDIKLLALSHNTIRGAAGGALLTAELAYKKGYL